MSQFAAFQIEVTSPGSTDRQVFFVAAASSEEAMSTLAKSSALLPRPALKLQRRLSDSEIDQHQIGPDTVMQWL